MLPGGFESTTTQSFDGFQNKVSSHRAKIQAAVMSQTSACIWISSSKDNSVVSCISEANMYYAISGNIFTPLSTKPIYLFF